MDDERKKPRGGKPGGGSRSGSPAGPRRSGKDSGPRTEAGKRSFGESSGAGGGKRFCKPDGEKRPYAKRGNDEGRKPFRPRREGEGGAEASPRRERPAEGSGGERKPRRFEDREGAPRGEGGLPKYYGKRPGRQEREHQKRGEFAPRRERPAHSEDAARSERKFTPRDGERKFTPRDGERSRSPGSRKFDAVRPSHRREEAIGAEPERIAKRLARAGISSRRDAENLIAMGRVKVNGVALSSPATNVTPGDRIEVDGTEIPAIERTRLFLFNKPAGVVTTNRDPEGRKTVFDVLPEGLPRLMTVGRLDINTEGLLLLTNDGGLSRVLELPATGWQRRYRVRVHGKVDESKLAGLKDGIAVDGVFYGAIEASLEREQGTNAWLNIGLREGKNREVKNILGALGLEVARLIRVSYGPFQLGELAEGHVLEVRGRMLQDQLGDRLIEESGANFDAGIAKPFSNKPVRRGDERGKPVYPSEPRRPREMNVGEGGLVKGRFRRDRERSREEFRDRLTTSRDEGAPEQAPRRDARPGKPAAKPGGFAKRGGDREERPYEPPGQRSSNVWMAPGAKPNAKRPSERAAAKRDAAAKGPRTPRTGGPAKPPRGKPPRKG